MVQPGGRPMFRHCSTVQARMSAEQRAPSCSHQKIASVPTVARCRLHCGVATSPGSTCATRADSTARRTASAGRSSNTTTTTSSSSSSIVLAAAVVAPSSNGALLRAPPPPPSLHHIITASPLSTPGRRLLPPSSTATPSAYLATWYEASRDAALVVTYDHATSSLYTQAIECRVVIYEAEKNEKLKKLSEIL